MSRGRNTKQRTRGGHAAPDGQHVEREKVLDRKQVVCNQEEEEEEPVCGFSDFL